MRCLFWNGGISECKCATFFYQTHEPFIWYRLNKVIIRMVNANNRQNNWNYDNGTKLWLVGLNHVICHTTLYCYFTLTVCFQLTTRFTWIWITLFSWTSKSHNYCNRQNGVEKLCNSGKKKLSSYQWPFWLVVVILWFEHHQSFLHVKYEILFYMRKCKIHNYECVKKNWEILEKI